MDAHEFAAPRRARGGKKKRTYARKTSTEDSRIWSAVAWVPKVVDAVTQHNAQLISDQYFLGHLQSNAYVEAERSRREGHRQIYRNHPALLEIYDLIEALLIQSADLADTIKQQRSTQRTRKVPSPEVSAKKQIAARLKNLRAQLKAQEQELPDDQGISQAHKDVQSKYFDQQKEVYSGERTYALAYGSKVIVRQSGMNLTSSPRPPRFKRFDGRGRIGVQFSVPPTTRSLLEGNSLRGCRLLPIKRGDTGLGRSGYPLHGGATHKFELRIGDEWISFWTKLHRPLPENAVLKWAWVSRRQAGTRYEYRLQFTLQGVFEPLPTTAFEEAVAVDVGWSEDGRVAYWYGTDGRCGEVLLPTGRGGTVRQRIDNADQIRAARDTTLEQLRTNLVTFIGKTDLPEALVKAFEYLAKWRAPKRFATLLSKWSATRFEGDEEIFEELATWCRQDKSAHDKEFNIRARALGHRDESYSDLAAELARDYKTLVLEDLQHSDFCEDDVTNKDPKSNSFRRKRNISAPATLTKELATKFDKRQGEIKWINPRYTSRDCSFCGSEFEWAVRSERRHVCVSCGTEFDRDHNAARNLLLRAGYPLSGYLQLRTAV